MEILIVLIASLILIVLTGYVLFKLFSSPFKVLGFLFKAAAILVLGAAVWLGLFYWIIHY